MSAPTEPTPTRDLFGQEIRPPADLVRVEPNRAPAKHLDAKSSADVADTAAAETRQRLLAHCQQLRATHRCPGRCVLTGELGRGGLAALQRLADDGP